MVGCAIKLLNTLENLIKNNMKLKNLFFVLLCIAISYSCKRQASSAKDTEMPTTEQLQEKEISSMQLLINEVTSCIDSIQLQEKMIFESREGDTSKEKILIQLRSFKDLLAKKQAQIDALTTKNIAESSSSKKTIQNLEKMIDFINAQLKEKSKQVEDLEKALRTKDAKIDELRYGLNALSKESEYLKEQNYQQDKELNTVYYIVATKKELKNLGLLKSNLFAKKVQNDNIDRSFFKKADRRGLQFIPIGDKSVKILTNNPKDSYTITTKEDGTSVLEITDADRFWSISPFLIVQK